MHHFLWYSLIIILVGACHETSTPKPDDLEFHDPGYTSEYQGPHFAHHQKFADYPFTREDQWDSLNGLVHHPVPMPGFEARPDYRTFGWHLYSKGSAYLDYNFSLLWGIAYFSYFVDPETGGYENIHEWKSTALVDSAHAHSCKVFLAISNFGAHNNTTFLENPAAYRTLSDSIRVLLKLRHADGVNIDFEGIPGAQRAAFSSFFAFLSRELKKDNPANLISVSLYAVDYQHVFDIPALNPYADFYTLMAYDYYGGFSAYAGPVSPLKSSPTWGKNSIETSVNYYLNAGVKPEKLIVGLPYYGAEWVTNTGDIPSKADKFYSHPTYGDIEHIYMDSLQIQSSYDPQSETNYFTFCDPKGNLRQVWFDDRHSLESKYNWIKKKHVSGIGIWALGYDHGEQELWELLANSFGQEK
jgi:spore germination protein YaaH